MGHRLKHLRLVSINIFPYFNAIFVIFTGLISWTHTRTFLISSSHANTRLSLKSTGRDAWKKGTEQDIRNMTPYEYTGLKKCVLPVTSDFLRESSGECLISCFFEHPPRGKKSGFFALQIIHFLLAFSSPSNSIDFSEFFACFAMKVISHDRSARPEKKWKNGSYKFSTSTSFSFFLQPGHTAPKTNFIIK